MWLDTNTIQRYNKPLLALGMLGSLSIELVLERVGFYIASADILATEEIARRAEALIISTKGMEIISSTKIRDGRWIPQTNVPALILVSDRKPSDCRDSRFIDIVGYSMDIMPFEVGPYWTASFGWLAPIPPERIKGQIEALTLKGDVMCLEKVLSYIDEIKGHDIYATVLLDFPWIPSISSGYFLPENIFLDDFSQLEPYCSTVKVSLRKHEDFLRNVGVLEIPSIRKLGDIMDQLAVAPLEDKDLGIAVAVCTIAARHYPNVDYSSFKAPDYRAVLVEIKDLIADDPYLCEGTVHFLHPAVPKEVINVMQIPASKEAHRSATTSTSVTTSECSIPTPIGSPYYTNCNRLRGTDSIRDYLDCHRAEDAIGIIIGYLGSLQLGSSFIEWRLEYGVSISACGKTELSPRLFLVTNGSKFFTKIKLFNGAEIAVK